MECRNEPLSTALGKLEKQTGFRIIFSHDDVSKHRVTVAIKQKTLREALHLLLDEKALSFQIEDKFITISPRGKRTDSLQEGKKPRFLVGQVLDEQRLPLPGTHISIQETQTVTSTLADGGFRVSVGRKEGWYTLHISYLGMVTQKQRIKVEAEQEEIQLPVIVLKEDNGILDEVVVTGYQVMSRRESASAITSIKAENILTPNAMSIDQMLQGQVPGMMVLSQSGEPSSTPTIRIRGNSTINGSKSPVWVVDGVIMSDLVPFTASDLNSPDAPYLIGNSISGLSPQDIESIDVLKDASATAIYGVKAANGVIVVTTKRGRVSRPVVNYTADLTLNTRPSYKEFDRMNSQERIALSQDIYNERLEYPLMPMSESYEGLMQRLLNKEITHEEFSRSARRYELMNTDWFDLLFRQAVTQNHNVSVNGGSDRMKYYASISYNDSPGIAKKSQSRRLTGLTKLNLQLNKGVDVELKLTAYSQTNDGYNGLNPFQYAYHTSRAVSPFNEDGSYYYYNRNRLTPVSYNFLNELSETGQQSKTQKYSGSFTVKARLLKGLTYQGVFSLDQSKNRLSNWATDHSYLVGNIRGYDFGAYRPEEDKYLQSALPFGGIYSDNHTDARSYTIRNTANYIERFSDRHDLNVMAGIELRSEKYTGMSVEAYGWNPQYGHTFSPVMTEKYLSEVKVGRFAPRLTDRITQVASYFGTASYSYDDRYVINANIRSDGSNKFGSNPKYRWLPTWSMAGKWIVSNESFMKNLRFVDQLAIRGSYGIQGNIHDDSTPYLIVRMERNNSVSKLPEGSIDRLPNPDLRWEKTKSYNLGVDTWLFDRRLGVTFDYYRKQTTDLITEMRVSPVTGRSNMRMNVGSAYNRGFEGSVSMDLIRSKSLDWNMSFNFSHNVNEVRYAFDASLIGKEVYQQMLLGNIATIGQPLGTIYSYKYMGLSSENGYPLFLATDGRSVHEGDLEVMEYVPSGSIYPDLTGGFDTRLTLNKNLTVSIGFAYQIGGVKRLPAIYAEADRSFDPISNVPRDFLNRWRKPGDELRTDIPALYDRTKAKNFPDRLLAYYDEGSYRDMSMPRLYDHSDLRIAKSDFLRLRTVLVSYRLPSDLLKSLHVSSMTLRLQANNLKTWKGKAWQGLDPETAYATMPIKPSFSFGLNVSF